MPLQKDNYKWLKWVFSKPKAAGFILFSILFATVCLVGYFRYADLKERRASGLAQITSVLQQNINQSLKNTENIAIAIAQTVTDNGEIKNFDTAAAKLYHANPYLQAIQLVPNGIISKVYPKVGNEAAIGVDLFQNKNSNTVIASRKAQATKQIFFQGPLKIAQGGTAIVGRLPIYVKNRFWGFSAIVIKLDTLFKLVGIDGQYNGAYIYQFSKVNPVTKKEQFLFPLNYNLSNREYKKVFFSQGEWTLFVIGNSKWQIFRQVVTPLILLLLLSLIASVLFVKLLSKRLQLRKEIDKQNNQLLHTESRYKTIFDNAMVGIARVNSTTGKFMEVNDCLCLFLGYDREELLDKKIKSIIAIQDLSENQLMFKKLLMGEIKEFNIEERYLTKNGQIKWGKAAVKSMWKRNEQPS